MSSGPFRERDENSALHQLYALSNLIEEQDDPSRALREAVDILAKSIYDELNAEVRYELVRCGPDERAAKVRYRGRGTLHDDPDLRDEED